MRQWTNTSLVSLFYAAQKTSIGPVKDWESIGDNGTLLFCARMECLTGSNDFDSLLGSDIRINFLGDLFLKNQGPSPIGSRAARNYSSRQTVNLRIAIFRPHAARPAARIKSKRTPLKKRTRQLLRTRDEVRLVTIPLTAVMRDAQLAKLRGADWATRVHANKPIPEPKNRADRRRCSPRCPICLEAG
jgi:hypothetical protein